jgi:hypothetical protein
MSGDGFFTFTDADPSQWLPKGIVDEREEHDAGAYASFALPQGSASRSASDDNSRGSFDSFGVKSKVLGSVLYDDEGLIPPGLGGHAYVDKSTSPKSTASPTAAFVADAEFGAAAASGSRLRGPSGPRRAGQGVEEEEQQVASIEVMANGGLRLRVTLLAAGFVIGASGASIREIMRHTGSTIQSWTQQPEMGVYHRPCRVFCIQGLPESVMAASNIIHEAVERYKELCEGKRRGEFVQRLQYIRGVEFSYQPPPKNAVPNAASVNGATRQGTNPLLMPRQPTNAANETMRLLAAAQAQRAAMQHYQNLAAQSYAAGLAAGAKRGHVPAISAMSAMPDSENPFAAAQMPNPSDFFTAFSAQTRPNV